MVDLSRLYSNHNILEKIVKFKHSLPKDAEIVDKQSAAEVQAKNEYGEVEAKRYRQKQKKLSKSEREDLVKMYLNGINTYTLAEAFNCHRVTVSRILKDAGINPTIEKLDLDEAIRLYESGWTTIDIAKKFDMSGNAVSRRLKDAGVKMRTRWDYK